MGPEEIRFWILTWGPKAVVLDPEFLREEIRVEAELIVKRYEAPIVAKKSVAYRPMQDHPPQSG